MMFENNIFAPLGRRLNGNEVEIGSVVKKVEQPQFRVLLAQPMITDEQIDRAIALHA